MPGAQIRAEQGSWGTSDTSAAWGGSGVLGTTGDSPAQSWDVLASASLYRTEGEDLSLPLTPIQYQTGFEGQTLFGGPQSGTDAERSPQAFLQMRRGEFSLTARTGYRRKGVTWRTTLTRTTATKKSPPMISCSREATRTRAASSGSPRNAARIF
jgi:hypothetical protein